MACRADKLGPGDRAIVDCDGRSVGVFNVDGRLFALHNRCPHYAAPVCLGAVSGTALPSDPGSYEYGRDGMILRCPWHGLEFDLETGGCLAQERIKLRTYVAAVEDGEVVVYI